MIPVISVDEEGWEQRRGAVPLGVMVMSVIPSETYYLPRYPRTLYHIITY
jgi:hypothetical protein